MSLLPTLLLLLQVATAADGDPCKGLKAKEDKFTHQIEISRSGVAMGWNHGLGWKAVIADNTMKMTLTLSVKGLHNAALKAGYPVKVLLEDGTSFDLLGEAEVSPVFTSGPITSWAVVIPVDPKRAAELSASPFAAFRWTSPAGEHTVENSATGLTRMLQCYVSTAK